MEHALLEIMFDLPSMPNLIKVVVDEGAIRGDNPPVLVYSDEAVKAESVS
jgi:ATP-dependent Clp protease ATP-binding subunit ClpX